MSNRVVITGLGAITPIGIGREAFWEALLAGKNGIDKITHFDASECNAQIAGEVKDFDPGEYIDKKEAKRMDRYTQFAVAAAKLAIEDAKLDLEKEDRERIGTFIGAGIGGIETMHSQYEKLFSKGPSKISPFFIPMMIANMAAGQVAITYGLHGPSACIVTACATGTDCIGHAFRAIEDAGLAPADIDYVNAHGTSTHMNDKGETEAIKTTFGAAAKDLSVSSIKSMTGHLLGAAGGVECIATALAVENDILPPTINYEEPDEGLDLDYVPNKAKEKKVRAAISNSFGFGGHNACLVLKKFQS